MESQFDGIRFPLWEINSGADLVAIRGLLYCQEWANQELSDRIKEADEVARRTTGRANDHAVDVWVELAQDLPAVMADRRRIVQVLTNLLSNATRFSPEGSPILVSAVRDGVHVAVSVSDRGRGIPAELLPEMFRKLSGPSGVDGSGLGLAICMGIVETLGGRIRAESDGSGLGARVTFTLLIAE